MKNVKILWRQEWSPGPIRLSGRFPVVMDPGSPKCLSVCIGGLLVDVDPGNPSASHFEIGRLRKVKIFGRCLEPLLGSYCNFSNTGSSLQNASKSMNQQIPVINIFLVWGLFFLLALIILFYLGFFNKI